MGFRYALLIEAGYSADYLDRCTLWDIDLIIRQVTALREQRAAAMRRSR